MNLKERAQAFQAQLQGKSFEEEILDSFILGSEIFKQYSLDEINHRIYTAEYSQRNLTSDLIKKDAKYLVTENSIEPYPTLNKHHGLYRYWTSLKKQTHLYDDNSGFEIELYYQTQRDHSDTVHKGNALKIKFENGKLYGVSIDKKAITEAMMDQFKIMQVKGRYYALLNDKVQAEAESGEILPIKDGNIDLLKLANFIATEFYKYKDYVIGVNKKTNFEIEYCDKEMRISNMVKIKLPEIVQELTLESCHHRSIKIPAQVKKLMVKNPEYFSDSHIPTNIEYLSLDTVKLPSIDLSRFEYLNTVNFYRFDNPDLDIPYEYDRLMIFDSWTIVKSMPFTDFDFRFDEKVWFGYSDYIYNKAADTKGILTTDDGVTFYFRSKSSYYHDKIKYKLSEVKKLFNRNVCEWAENIDNQEYYVNKLRKKLINNTFRCYGNDSIEPGTYHGEVYDMRDAGVKNGSVLDIKIGKKTQKYMVAETWYDNGSMTVVPYELRFLPTAASKAIQITDTRRMESLMSALYEVNQIPFNGWRRKKVEMTVTNEIITEASIDAAMQNIDIYNIHGVLDRISLSEFIETNLKSDRPFKIKNEYEDDILRDVLVM